MKKLFTSMMVASAMALLSACASTENAGSVATPTASVKEMPVYQVRTTFIYAPFNIPEGNQIIGLDIDLMNAIAQDQGFRVQYTPHKWEGMFKNLKQNNVDIVSNGFAATDIDSDETIVSQPYLKSRDCVIGTQDKQVQQWTRGQIAVIPDDELAEDLQAEFKLKTKQFVEVDDQAKALLQVGQGKVPVVVSDCTVLKYYIKNDKNLAKYSFKIKELEQDANDTSSDLVIAVRKDQPELLKKINAGLENLKRNGQLDKIIQKWI